MIVDVNEVVHKLRSLKLGDRYIYHTGYIARDRVLYSSSQTTKEKAAAIDVIASEAMTLSNKRKVCLVQRRIKDFVYDYIAIGTTI